MINSKRGLLAAVAATLAAIIALGIIGLSLSRQVELLSAPPATDYPALPDANVPGVVVTPLQEVAGDLVFATRTVEDARAFGVTELWAIPVAPNSEARVVLRYPRNWVAEAWPTRYLSPDGRRYAFQADRGDGVHRIVIADLFKGTLSWLPTDDSLLHDGQPVWDPEGKRIAFNRIEGSIRGSRSLGLWVVNVDGTRLEQLAQGTNAPTYIYHWTPDGASIAIAQNIGYDLVDATTGSLISMGGNVSGASWRSASPRLIAIEEAPVPGGHERKVFTAGSPNGLRTVVLNAPPGVSLFNPRWRPGTDDFLYFRTGAGQHELRIRSLTGSERTLPIADVGSPVWTPDGSAFAYTRSEKQPMPGTGPLSQIFAIVTAEIRLMSADGSDDRLLYRSAAEPGDVPPSWCVCLDGLTIRTY